MHYIVLIARILVGTLFVVSGLIKANDALGFMYKLEEYFEPGALNLVAWAPYALELAVFICISEILLGVALLTGAWPRLTASLTAAMMAFFTWLTWYTSTCDPYGMKTVVDAAGLAVQIPNQCVLSCGCFGNAIPLTPYESFLKDVVLSILTLPILFGAFTGRITLNRGKDAWIAVTASLVLLYVFCEAMLHWNFPVLFLGGCWALAEGVRRRLTGPGQVPAMAAATLVLAGAFQTWTLAYEPVRDYRPYAVGEDLIKNRKTAEELGLEPPQFAVQYTFRNVQTGADTVVMSTDWLAIYKEPAFASTYEVVSYEGPQVKIRDGYEPPILDLQMLDAAGNDVVDSVLNLSGWVWLHVSRDLGEAGARGTADFQALQEEANARGWHLFGLTSAPPEEVSAFTTAHGLSYPFLGCDQTELKIIARSNPALLLLQDGVVRGKWAWRDLPEVDEMRRMCGVAP
jgi:uncharacterized membrane protein YphA (DoxX/SURF4 family)